MKQRVLLLLNILMVSIGVFAENRTISFQLSDGMIGPVRFFAGPMGNNIFWETDHIMSYENDPNVPGLPYITKNIDIPDGFKVVGMDYVERKTEFSMGVFIAPNAVCQSDTIMESIRKIEYASGIYPENKISIGHEHYSTAGSFVSIKYAPFEYEYPSKKLSRKVYDVVFHLKSYTPKGLEISESARAFKNKVIRKTGIGNVEESDHQIDYIVLTTEALKSAFEPLVEWKRVKGLKSQVITLEEVREAVGGESLDVYEIKTALSFLLPYGLKYVLIGGDDTIIPTFGVYGNVGDYESTIPTDMFYACIDENNMQWNYKPNPQFGELEDECDLVPALDITRVPIRTLLHASNVVDKILLYEKNPKKYGWGNSVLTAGGNKNTTVVSEYRVEAIGTRLYNMSFKDLWYGERLKYYDSCPFVQNGVSKDFTSGNLIDVLNEDFGLMQMICHGNEMYWQMPNDNFTSLHAAVFESKQPFILTTTSNHANAFDYTSDPTLGESFMRSARSGVVGMLGSSREAWMYDFTSALSPSLQYEKAFYDVLFSSTDMNKQFGYLVNKMKSKFWGMCGSYSAERWLQFSINPYGDPEMQIFPSTPKDFKKLGVVIGPDFLLSDLEDVNYTFGVYDTKTEDSYQVFSDDYMWWFPLSNISRVSLMKFGYVPSLFDVESNKIILNGESYAGGHYYGANQVVVGDRAGTQEVLFKDGEYTFIGGSIELLPGVTFESGASVSIISGQTVSTTNDAKALISKRRDVEPIEE